MITTILATLFVLGVLIFVHELGHFLFAKLFGIRVERFSLGYPPRAFGFQRGDTDYCVSWVPLGGYCKMAGMVDESLDSDSIKGEPWEFQSKPSWIKAIVIAAGPGMNFILTVIVFSLMAYGLGIPKKSDSLVIGGVQKEGPASEAGIREGDIIVSIDGQKISTWQEMTDIIRGNISGNPQIFEWLRDGKTYSAEIQSEIQKVPTGDDIENVRFIGVLNYAEIEKVGIIGAVKHGFSQTYDFTKLILIAIKKLVTGEESIKSLGGPIFIAKLAGESAKSGIWSLIGFMGFLSLNLGLLNIMPVPVLDGGHLVFISVESIIRRPIPIKLKLIMQQVGMALLLILITFIIYNDVLRVMK